MGKQSKNDLKVSFKFKTYWYVIIIAVLLLISFGYMLLPGRMLDCGDQLLGYSNKLFSSSNMLHGKGIPLWNPYLFSGLPFIGAMHGDILYPSLFLRLIFPPEYALALLFLLHFLFAGIFMFFLAKELGSDNSVSLLIAFLYMFTGIIISQVNPGHDGKVIVESFTPAVFLFLTKGIRTRRLFYYLVSGGFIGLCLLAPNVQLTYYMLMGTLIWFVSELVGNYKKDFKNYYKNISFALIALGFALAVSAAQFIPFLEYSSLSPRQTTRGWEFATSWSMPLPEFFDAMISGFSGIKEKYWGENFFKLHTEYMGVIPFLFAPLALFSKNNRDRRRAFTLAGISAFFLIVSFGGHTAFYKPLYILIPGFNKFRAPSISFFMFCFSLIASTSLTMKNILASEIKKMPLIVFSILLLILIALSPALASKIAQNSDKIALAAQNTKELNSGAMISSFVLIFSVASILLCLKYPEKKRYIFFLFCFVAFTDLYRTNSKFVQFIRDDSGKYLSAEEIYKPDFSVNFVKNNDSLYRIMPTTYFDLLITQNGVRPVDNHSSDNYLMANGLYSPGGYHGNQLQRYQDLIGLPQTIMFQNGGLLSENINLCRLLGIKFQPLSKILYSEIVRLSSEDPDRAAQLADMFGLCKTGRIRMDSGVVVDAGNMVLLVDTLALPKAFLVPSCRVITDDEACLAAVHDENIDFSRTVILSEEPGIAGSSGGSAEITEYSPDRIKVSITTEGPSFLVINDNYAPGWKAYVDGNNTEILRAYYSLRCVPVSSGGEHELLMIYDPLSVRIGYAVTLAAIILWSILMIISWRKKI
ncbi:hypothetical protein JXL83_04480 [candidate division WOR-3 bacterium]|nr:hypothetical protein [candidate division WOR-3 bacterium]